MKKTVLFLCTMILCAAVLCPVCAFASTPLDPAAEASLTLYYRKEEKGFPGLKIRIYRVAEAFPDGTFGLIEPYASLPVQIHDITVQEQWKNTAMTLTSYIVADQIPADRTGETGGDGAVSFDALKTGLYLVSQAVAEDDEGTYVFNQFLVYLPTPRPDATFEYAVQAHPKCVKYVPKTEYRVTKLWQDSWLQTDRPAEVSVDIFKDGVLQETQILNAGNNWSYRWYVSEDDPGVWTVAERSVSEWYTVTVQQNGASFSIINNHRSNQDVPDSPPTADSFPPIPWILGICLSGMAVLILGIYRRRRA